MTSTVAIDHLTRARAARDAGKLADCLHQACVSWGIADAEGDYTTGRDAISTIARSYLNREEHEEARRWYGEALDYAKAHNLVLGIAHAAHDLYLAAVSCGKRDEAHRAMETALLLYNPRSQRVSGLIADRSMEEMATEPGYVFHAWKAFASSLPKGPSRDRVYATANIVTAVSHFKTAALFEHYWPTLRAMLDRNAERASLLYTIAAEDLCRRDRREEAHRMAEIGLEIAVERGEGTVRERAEHAMDAANCARVPDAVL